MLLNTIRILLIFCLIAIVCAPPKSPSTKDKKPSKDKKSSTSNKEKKPSTNEKAPSTSSKIKKPKRIGFLTALAIVSKISPELALNYGPKAYKAMKKRYVRGKARFQVMGEDGKMRDTKKGEAVKVDLSHPETYAIIDEKQKDVANVAHPNLLSYEPPDPEDIHPDSPTVMVEHMLRNGLQIAQQAPYKVQSSYDLNSLNVAYAPAYNIYGKPKTGDVNYTTDHQPITYTEHKPHNPDQGPPKNEIPPTRAITEITLWPGFMEVLPDGSSMELYHIPYAFAEDSTFSLEDKKLIRQAMDKFAEMTCVRFTPAWEDGQHHIAINNKKDGGCCSWVGIEKYFGNQPLNLEAWCMEESIIIHELMHGAGLHHPQHRNDRNKHIKVFWDYIGEKSKSGYQLYTNYQPEVPYDKRSVMHYLSYQNEYPEYSSMTDLAGQPIMHEHKVQLGDWHWVNVTYQCEHYMQKTKKYFDNWSNAN